MFFLFLFFVFSLPKMKYSQPPVAVDEDVISPLMNGPLCHKELLQGATKFNVTLNWKETAEKRIEFVSI